FLDGSTIALTATSQLQGALNNQAEEPAFVHIDANHEIDEVAKEIFIEINVTPYISVEGCVMHVSVIEKETTGNTGNNGETEFQHVNMKLYPNANGTSLNLTADEVENFDFTINMNGTNVEEYSDLAVVVFIQNVATKHVLQSTYSNTVGLYTTLFTVQKNGEPLVDAKIVTNEQTLYTNATGQASLELENGEYTYTVSKDGYNSSEGSFEILNQPVEISIDMVPTNIAEEVEANLSIYPNPSNGIFTLKTDGIYQLSIFNTVGQAILHRRVDGDSIIDLSRFPKGVYTVLIKNSKSFSSKRIVIK
ncbi:MAG: T9SS type A sorting domain-containing protein, partial [Bacteroidales bacterium]|nr:T9SS type A sorting domain-containing protein [Bacteroidales bacterium]